MKKLINDQNAATPTYEYIILVGIILVYLTLFIALFANEFEIAPTRTAMQAQFEDVGNDVSSKVVDMYVTAPETGYLRTKFYMPPAVGKYEYKVEFKETAGDNQIQVSALSFEKEVGVTLNRIGSSLGLSGSTYSVSPDHWIRYSMGAEFNLTAVAIAYPRAAAYNLTAGSSVMVTFDGSYSKGLGKLQHTWNFGDGSTSNSAVAYHQYNSTGVYNATLTVYDPLLVRSANSSVLINVTSGYIEPGLDLYKFVSPESFQAGEPAFIDIVLYGKGIPQNESRVDVILVTDITGSMDPDYPGTGDSGYAIFKNTSGVVQSACWTGNITVDSTFFEMSVGAYSVNGTKDINLWLRNPSGTIERAQTLLATGEIYYKKNPVSGNWTAIVVGNFSQGTQDISVRVNKTYPNKTVVTVANYSGTITSNAYNTSVVAEDFMENFKVELNNINGSKSLRMWISKNGSTPFYTGSRYTDTNVAKDTNYTVYVTGDFPEGSQEFNLTFHMAKLDAAKISGKTFTDCLGSSDKVGHITFCAPDKKPKITLVQPLGYNKTAVKNSFNGLKADGWTPTAWAISNATKELTKNSTYFTAGDKTRLPVIILMTDGIPNIPEPTNNAIALTLSEANKTKSEGILIYTIGLGVDANMTLLANVSSGEGYYFYAATKEELQAIYSQIARELREFAAKNVVLTDVVSAGITVESAPGADSVIKNLDGTTTILWKVGSVKIHTYGQQVIVKRLMITTMTDYLTSANELTLSNSTYYHVLTGNLTTVALPLTNINVRSMGGWQMSLE